MRNSLRQFSGFVGEMNELARQHDAQSLANWAVQKLSETVGFDCAWYGWAQLRDDGVDIHAQCSHNLTGAYYQSWCEIAEEDLLAAAIRKNPLRTAVYDRRGRSQTDGMISLADCYGLNKMATAMHARAGRSASFYLSSYRGGPQSRCWSTEELDYLKCAVDQLSSAMHLSIAEAENDANSHTHSILVSDDGIVILGLQKLLEKIGYLWPEWKEDRLPDPLRNLIHIPGEHILVDRQLIVDCGPASGINNMKLHRFTVRPLTRFDLLTQREREVAGLLADGNSHKEAARILGVAPATVRNQTQSIYSKMGVTSRAELALQVRLRGSSL